MKMIENNLTLMIQTKIMNWSLEKDNFCILLHPCKTFIPVMMMMMRKREREEKKGSWKRIANTMKI